MWNEIGFGIATAAGIAAWLRSRTHGGHYDAGIYAMTAAAHRRYALGSLAFALFFAVAWSMRWEAAGLGGLTVYTLIVIIYAASFLRGAEEDRGGQE